VSGEDESFDGDVEDRIVGQFMRQIQNSEIDFYIVEEMEALIEEDDFGGEDVIVDRVREAILNNEDQ
jgi:hypothetical protein